MSDERRDANGQVLWAEASLVYYTIYYTIWPETCGDLRRFMRVLGKSKNPEKPFKSLVPQVFEGL